MIDPLGFGLEQFDPVGRTRKVDEMFAPIDASGTMPDGTKFDGVAGLSTALVRQPENFVGTLTEKLLTYALGRGLEYYDMPAVRTIVHGVGATLALPMLDAMWPALSAAEAAPIPRMGFFYAPNGTYLPNFHPKAVGANFDWTPVLKPLEPLGEHITVVSGLANKG